jgi:hypothetical protein
VGGPRAQTIASTITAPLVWAGDHWQANFEQGDVACQGAYGIVAGVEDSTWTIRLSRDGTLSATESTFTHGAACASETSTLAWSAGKLGSQPPASA